MNDFDNYISQIRREGSLHQANWYDTTNEVIRLMYSTLGWLVRGKWEKLVITKSHVLYGRGDVLRKHFDEISCEETSVADRADCTTFREAMHLIYEHDARVRQHFQLTEETSKSVTYSINSSPTEAP